jgi:hypothetical protein
MADAFVTELNRLLTALKIVELSLHRRKLGQKSRSGGLAPD